MKIYEYEMVPFLVGEMESEYSLQPGAPSVVEYMRGAFDKYPEQETFWVLPVNRKNKVKARILVTLGTQTAALADPKEVLRRVLLANGSGFVCVHNHPAGDPSPSAPDLHVTRLIREGAKAVDLSFLDHVIIGTKSGDPLGKGWFSFREAGLII